MLKEVSLDLEAPPIHLDCSQVPEKGKLDVACRPRPLELIVELNIPLMRHGHELFTDLGNNLVLGILDVKIGREDGDLGKRFGFVKGFSLLVGELNTIPVHVEIRRRGGGRLERSVETVGLLINDG